MGDILGGIFLIVLVGLAVSGVFNLVDDSVRLPSERWECIVIQPATEIGEEARCVAYRATDVEWAQ